MQSAQAECKTQRAPASEIAPPKLDLDAKAKNTILKHFLRGILKGKSPAPKLRNSRDKSLWHYGSLDPALHDLLCPAAKDNSIRTRPRRQATLTQPLQCDRHRQRTIQTELQSTIELRARTSAKRLMNYQFHCDLQRLSCKTQKNYAQKRRQNDA